MSYRLKDGYPTEEQGRSILPNGQDFPVPSLIEGEQDGLLVLLTLGETVPVSVYASAVQQGCEIIYRQSPTPAYIFTDEFVEFAELNDSQSLYTLPSFIWHPGSPEELFVPQETTQARTEASESFEKDEPVVEGRFQSLVHLHTHSEFSALDGLAKLEEIVKVAKSQGSEAVAITDHGVCSSHPALQKLCDENEIKPIFGMEAYLVDDRFDRSDAKDYMHITLWAMNDAGLKNLWAISTEGYRDGFHGHPRVDWDTLTRLSEGILASSGCLRGPLAYHYLNNSPAKALQNSQKLIDIYGDRYYIEIHANLLGVQVEVNQWLVSHAREFGIPMIAAVDSHYATEDQRDDHQVWLSIQTNKDVEDESSLFGGGQDYHMLSETEVIQQLGTYLPVDVIQDCLDNTVALARRCTARITPRSGLPLYSTGADAADQDRDKMLDWCFDAWEERVGYKGNEEEYVKRFEREAKLLIDKGFPGYFLMNADLVRYAKSNGVLVGPGRGSGAASLVAYLMGITEVDPVENDLLFERFMTEGRTALPDFDIDYPSSKKQFMIDYAEKRWGKQHVCAVGTHLRMKNKSAFKDTARAIRSRLSDDSYVDVDKISAIITAAEASTAGLGLSWDEMIAACEDEFAPYQRKYPELFDLAEKFRGRLKTYSRHAAGLIIDPQYNLEGALPMFLAPDGVTLTTQFDKDELETLGYVKFDFLNLRNLDTIQLCVDLVEAQLGIRIDVNKWRDEYKDQDVYEEICKGWTLGLFQIETPLGTRTVKRLKPRSLADLSDAITLGRPGPIRSGLDETYFRRREGKEAVSFADDRLKDVLAKTYGTMIYQEDIMAVTIVLAQYTDNEADYVRKILGKKKPEEAAKEGLKFIERAVANNTPREVAEALWVQMEEFSRYSFNRGHAFAYGTLSYWTAWLKYHYPVQYATAVLSTIDQDEIPDWVAEARRLGFKVLPPDINDSQEGFANTATEVRYGLKSIKGVGDAATQAILVNQPYSSFDDFMERKGDKCNMGHIKTLARIGAFDSIEPNRKALELRLAEEDLKPGERCIFFQLEPKNKYNDLPCAFDWDSEPPKLGRTGKPLKTQPKPPAKCSKACRNWTPREITSEGVEPYTDEEIREIEMEVLGIYLSSSPFDQIPDDVLEELTTADEIQDKPSGEYLCAIMINRVKDHRTKDGKLMKFVTVDTPSGSMDITIFSDKIGIYEQFIRQGQMAFAEVQKNDRGMTLRLMEPI